MLLMPLSERSQEGHLPVLSSELCSGVSWMTGPSVDSLEVFGWEWVEVISIYSLKA